LIHKQEKYFGLEARKVLVRKQENVLVRKQEKF
jgi:hypothetical protein